MKNQTTTNDAGKRTSVASMSNGQSVQIMRFVSGDVIPPACYDRPYCLEPAKDDDKAYEVLREAMHRTHTVGLASVVIEKKQTLAAVIPIGRTLVLNVLRFATGLVPRARRAGTQPFKASAPATSQASAPASVAAAPRKRAVSAPEVVKPVARIAPVRKRGEVIDLAVRRSTKRATQPRTAKPGRARAAGVATLHELPRKPATRTIERQLA